MKRSKEAVDYSPGMKSSHCGICTHFESPHSCEKVKGEIDPNYWCKLFEKMRLRASITWIEGAWQ